MFYGEKNIFKNIKPLFTTVVVTSVYTIPRLRMKSGETALSFAGPFASNVLSNEICNPVELTTITVTQTCSCKIKIKLN